MSLEKERFTSYDLNKKKNVFTVRVNDEERKLLEELKEVLNVASDGKALKIGALVGLNVLHSTFTRPVLKYLFKKDRIKLEDYKDF